MSKELEAIVNQAFQAAREAEAEFKAQHGEPQWPCGFAWVTVTPGNSKVANYLKKQGLARKAYSGGVSVWNPGGSFTQNMDIKEQGARAFADVLRAHGYDAYADSRMD